MNPKHCLMTVRKIAPPTEAAWDVEFVCSNEVVDRSDEVIHADGWQLDRFRANPVMLACHQHKLDNGRSPVIGSWPTMAVEGDALVGRAKFADTELGREYATLYRDGHMRAVSVGFMPTKTEERAVENAARGAKRTRTHYVEQELYEVSAVAVGCNHEALARLRTMGVEEVEAASCRLSESEIAKAIADGIATAVAAMESRLAEQLTMAVNAAVYERMDQFIASLPDYREQDREDATPPGERAGGAADVAKEETAKAARLLAAELA